jgi:hypothetical protein
MNRPDSLGRLRIPLFLVGYALFGTLLWGACDSPTAPQSYIEGGWVVETDWIVITLNLKESGGKVKAEGLIISDVAPGGMDITGEGIFIVPHLSLFMEAPPYAPFNITALLTKDGLEAIVNGSGFYNDQLLFRRR